MNFRRFALLASLGCSALATAFVANADTLLGPHTVSITVDGKSFDTVKNRLAKVGDIVSVDRVSHTIVLAIDVADPDETIEKISQVKGVEKALLDGEAVRTPIVDLRSLSSIRAALAMYPKEEPRHDRTRRTTPAPLTEEKDGPDYLRALEYFTAPRAYPFDEINWNAYQTAAEHAAQMKPVTTQPPVSEGGGAKALVSLPSPTGVVLGSKWKYVGPNNLNTPYRVYYGFRPSSGRINAVAYDPRTAGTYYLGGGEGGIWKSTDFGVTWKALGDKWDFISVSSIVLDPNNSNIIYVGTGDFHGGAGGTMGLMKSIDGGTTWTNLGRSSFGNAAISTVLVDPKNSQSILVATGNGAVGNGFLWKSSDGGSTWSEALNVAAPWSSLTRAVADSSGVRSLYAAAGGNSALVYRSDDNGATWSKLTTQVGSGGTPALSVAASAVDGNTAYLEDPLDKKIWKTTNKGSSWTDISGNVNSSADWGQSWYDYYLYCFANGGADDLMLGLIDVTESTNSGTSWSNVGMTETGNAITHNDQHSIAVNPNNSNEMLIGNDGGIYRATRSGSTWSIVGLSKNLGVTMFYDARWDPTDKTKMIGGSQDNATPVSTGDLTTWGNVGGGDGGFVAFDPANSKIQYCTIYGFTVIQTQDGWASSQDISPNIGSDNSPFVTPIYADPTHGNYLYGCTNFLWRFDSNTGTWTARLGGTALSNGSLIHAVAVAPSNGNVIYTGSDDGQLYVSRDGGNSFSLINSGASPLPNRAITSISVSPSNPNDILVGLSGTGTAHLVRCSDTSSTSRSYLSVSGSGPAALPDIPLNCIERDLKTPGSTFYVGTDIGVFASGDGGATWQNATVPLGLPSVQVTALQAMSYGSLNASTYGRGIWQIPFGSSSGGGGINPFDYSVVNGTQLSGSLASLFSDDTNTLNIASAQDPQFGQIAAVKTDYNIPAGSVSELDISLGASSSALATTQIFAYNQKTRQYDLIKAVPSSSSNADNTVSITVNPTAYVSPGRVFTVLVRSFITNRKLSGGFTFRVDHVTANAVVQ